MGETARSDDDAQDGLSAQREVEAALGSGDIERAVDLACGALDRGLATPLLLNLRAMRLQGEGRVEPALADLERAHRLSPGDFIVLNAMGLCLGQLDRLRDAVRAFDQAIALEPRFAPAQVNKGRTLEVLGDLKSARDCYQRALEQDPDHVEALAKLALFEVRRGDLAAARGHAGRALALNPAQPAAALVLARADIAEGAFGAADARLSAFLDRPHLSAEDRASALGLRGDALDGLARPADAFNAYAAANAIYRQSHAAAFAGPGATSAHDAAAWLTRYFQQTPAVRWASAARTGAFVESGAAEHVFLVGFPRSGTTLLEQVLASHPQVVSLEEHETLTESVVEFMSDPAGLDRLSGLGSVDLLPFRQAYWRRVKSGGVEPAGKVFVDKLPLNTLKLPLVAKLFPAAKVVFALRDPRDVVLSCFRRQFRMNASMYELLTLEGAARYYDDVMGLGELYREKLPLELRALRYEDLVADFDGQARAACAFLGLEWSDSMRDFAERARGGAIATPSSIQVAEGLYERAVGQWRRYRQQLGPVLPVLKPWIESFGYPAD